MSSIPCRYGVITLPSCDDSSPINAATPSTVPSCRAMLRIPLPTPNQAGGIAEVPAPSSDGMLRPTPMPPMTWAGSISAAYDG
ncbi:MAG TPA: hypothetical protein VHV76_11160 [Mycobacteriales bacterium]|nr:hypothetical protein [Mycobacteriales bacterium]